MRLLVRLDPQDDGPYNNDYHYRLQGLLYSLIRDGGREDVHDKQGYKFFCFSNIFPYRENFAKGLEQELLISSPDPEMVSSISRALRGRMEGKTPLQVGEIKFSISGIEGPFHSKMPNDSVVRLISSTPIIIRIPAWRYGDYGIVSNRPFENWRDNLPLEAFVKQLRDNMEKKFKEYSSLNVSGRPTVDPQFPEIVSYRYLKSVSKPITVKGERQQVIGSIWEIEFAVENEEGTSMLQFALDSGFGERNSLGFGFMNIR
ncbi:MAG: CRISPR-associated endoribonuclease Cas6 [Nitrososphaerales archaeon]